MTDHPTPHTDPSGAGYGAAEHWILQTRRLLQECGITDWPRFVARVRARRSIEAGGSLHGWAEADLLAVLRVAVQVGGHPAATAPAALLWVAADPATGSPWRLAEDGPWWTPPVDRRLAELAVDPGLGLRVIEQELDAADGLRPRLQALAREQLAAESGPPTREAVLRRAHQMLRIHRWAESLPVARESVWAKAWRLAHRPLLRDPQPPPPAPPARRRGWSR
jgi:hypothetical protein